MADPNGPTTDALIAELEREPYAYDFFAALRLLQRLSPDGPRLGHSWSPRQDPVRLAQSPGLDFAPAALESLRHKDPARPGVLFSRHFGLFGPNGPLPLCLTEYARDRIQHFGDATFVSFCNVFHHRLLSFLFRAWADAQKTVDADRAHDQCWPHYVGALVGLGMESLEGRESVPDRAKLYFAGRLVHHARNAGGLEAIIEDFFAIKAEVHTFVGRWLNLPQESLCKVGRDRASGCLGQTLIVGARVWTTQMHFRIRLGPMRLSDLERLLPNGAAFKRLKDWVRQYVGDLFSWDAQLLLKKDEVPSSQLGRFGRLGWTTWLKTKPFEHDAGDLVLVPT